MPLKWSQPQPRLLIASLSLGALIFGCLSGVARPAHSAAALQPGLQASEQAQIDAYIASRMRTTNIPGLALGVVRGDQIVYLKGYGVAGQGGRTVTPQTPFIIGSLSKSFTALAVMQLVEAGQIDLDAPVTRYLPWFRTADSAASAQITVRQLLNQDSGLPVFEGRRGLVDDDQADAALETGVRQLATVTLSRPAGQAFEYANENYTTLGLIVQAVSGTSYEDVIRAKILAPLQMRHSAAALTDPAAQGMATGYRYWLWWPIAFDAPYPRRQTPAGFLISSAEDMSHYLSAHLNGGAYAGQAILSPSGVDTLHAPGAPLRVGATSAYAMGWVVRDQAGAVRLEHNGDISNYHANMLLLPDQKIGIVILTNVNGFNHGAALNLPIEGVAAILQGHGISPAVDPPTEWLRPALLLLPVLVAFSWAAGSLACIRHWLRRGGLPVRALLGAPAAASGGRQGVSVRIARGGMPDSWPILWRCALLLAVDLCLGGAAWLILPARFQAPLATIGLFAPDVMVVIGLLTGPSLTGALGRNLFVFLSVRKMRSAGR